MDTRADAFLGGRVSIRQPTNGYRAGADPVFLAASVPANPGETVLELGCGVATALLCLNARVSGLTLTGVERDPALAQLARENSASAGAAAHIHEADIAKMPPELTAQAFDHVLFNPPFFDRRTGSMSPNDAREAGRGTLTEIKIWADTALRRLRPRGVLTMIHRVERLPETLGALSEKAGAIQVVPLQPRIKKRPKLFILRAKKGSNAAFELTPGLVLHQGDRHETDGDTYTEAATQILRNGAALPVDF